MTTGEINMKIMCLSSSLAGDFMVIKSRLLLMLATAKVGNNLQELNKFFKQHSFP
jgi:hypothetical protein